MFPRLFSRSFHALNAAALLTLVFGAAAASPASEGPHLVNEPVDVSGDF
ncbi:MAG: hypothetical protein QOD99_2906, partial [Chthoniobacter sp.]|nr:hypothetical protein [Chthoniobacter sp.]